MPKLRDAKLRAGSTAVRRVYQGATEVWSPAVEAELSLRVAQGSTDPAALYVWVTWSRVLGATGYEVLRGGAVIGTVNATGDLWDKCAFRDGAVTRGTHTYQVRPVGGSASAGVQVRVRANTSENVYTPTATTRAGVQAAIDAAAAAALAAGSDLRVVQLAASTTYTLDAPLVSSASDLVIRGGVGTLLKASFLGDAANGSSAPAVWQIDGGASAVALTIGADTAAGGLTLPVTDAAAVSVGDWLLLNQTVSGAPTVVATTAGVRMDPGGGWNDGHAMEIQQVTAKTATSLTFAQPIGSDFTSARALTQARRLTGARGCGLENVTVEGPSATNANFMSCVRLWSAPQFTFADVTLRFGTRSQVDVRDAPFCSYVGVTVGDQSNVASSDAPGIYAINHGRSPDSFFVACTFGSDTSNVNAKSFITWNRAHRAVVRHCVFGQTKTYCINEHGYTSRRIRVENNRFTPGPDTKFSTIFLGNEDFGFGADTAVRNNLSVGGSIFVRGRENSFGVRVLDNEIRSLAAGSLVTNPAAVDIERSWAGPDTAAALHGSSRWVVKRNKTVTCAGPGVRAGFGSSPNYPFNGVRDVLSVDNDFAGSSGGALSVPAPPGPVTQVATFDAGIEGWLTSTGVTLEHETVTRHEGAGALAVTKTFTTTLDTARVWTPAQSVLDKTSLGDTIGAWMFVFTTAPGTNWIGRMNIQDSAGVWHAPTDYSAVPKGAWTFIRWVVPPSVLLDVKRYGVQPASASGNLTADTSVRVLVDTVEQGNGLRNPPVVENVGATATGAWTSETF